MVGNLSLCHETTRVRGYLRQMPKLSNSKVDRQQATKEFTLSALLTSIFSKLNFHKLIGILTAIL